MSNFPSLKILEFMLRDTCFCFRSYETTEQRLDVQLSCLNICMHVSSMLFDYQYWTAVFSFMTPHPVHTPFTIARGTEHQQFYICLLCFKVNIEKQRNVTEPPKTLPEATSLASDQINRLNLRKINSCFNLWTILSVLLPAALFLSNL